MEEVRLHRVEHVEEVLSGRSFALWKDVGEVLGDLGILSKLWPQGLHGQLIVVRHLDEDDLILLQEFLLPGEDLLQKVLVDVDLRR